MGVLIYLQPAGIFWDSIRRCPAFPDADEVSVNISLDFRMLPPTLPTPRKSIEVLSLRPRCLRGSTLKSRIASEWTNLIRISITTGQ